ncbi:conserved exported protein of unknown function [Nitrospira japonica]|uniref:Uncharacterized protein n=1 Tax=Nitrospira japonica TaxID=1325564 RepID=A0A1W1I7Q4_9BACT|nr:hypothetical protein [Nitrospira japonica]SLM49078.1 conserved exported protein of unknown function [Nitrospira japonica]
MSSRIMARLAGAGWVTAVLFVAQTGAASAETNFEGRALLFYTDDVGIFSATRRLTRDEDPTQPALDSILTNQGSDVVFEPDAIARTSVDNRWGTTHLSIRGQGFIYAENPRYNHGTLKVQALQAFTPDTHLLLRYYYAPNLFLGENEDRRPGGEGLVNEVVTSQIASARIEQRLTKDVEVRLLGRVGIRRYNDAFAQRDTNFWTIGPHVEWRVSERVKLGLSYHYERGLAEGRNEPQLRDDVSYVNNYVSADVDVELMERLSLSAAFHYERNDWTSGIVGDIRNGAHEDVIQGEVMLIQQLTESIRAMAGFQRSNRKQSFEPDAIKNTNVAFGVAAVF